MKTHVAVMLSTLIFATACEPELELEEKPQRYVVPPTGNVSASEFASIYAQTCVAHFPNVKEIAKKTADFGFEIREYDVGTQSYRLSHENKDLFAATGTGVEGTRLIQFCSMTALLSNPEELEQTLEAVLVDVDGDQIDFVDHEQFFAPSYRAAIFKGPNGQVRVTFNQSISDYQPKRDSEPPEECKSEKQCAYWSSARLQIEWASQP